MNGMPNMMNRETKTRVEIALAFATVLFLYLLNWIAGL